MVVFRTLQAQMEALVNTVDHKVLMRTLVIFYRSRWPTGSSHILTALAEAYRFRIALIDLSHWVDSRSRNQEVVLVHGFSYRLQPFPHRRRRLTASLASLCDHYSLQVSLVRKAHPCRILSRDTLPDLFRGILAHLRFHPSIGVLILGRMGPASFGLDLGQKRSTVVAGCQIHL